MTDLSIMPEPGDQRLPQKVHLEVPEMQMSAEMDVSEAEAESILKESNLSRVSVKSIKNYRKLGKYLKKSGLLEYSRGRLLATGEALEDARESMLRIVTGAEPAETPLRIAAAQAVNVLVKTEIENLEMAIQLEKLQADDRPSRPASSLPPPGPIVMIKGENVNVS